MSISFGYSEGGALLDKVAKALDAVRKIIDNSKKPILAANADHVWEDKFLLAEFLTCSFIAANINCLTALGFTADHLAQMRAWAATRSVTLRFTSSHTCTFLKEVTSEVESKTKTVTKAFGVTITDKVINTVVEYFWNFTADMELAAYVGTGSAPGEVLVIRRRAVAHELKTTTKSAPHPASFIVPQKSVNITWLLNHLNSVGQPEFKINRHDAKCFTPRRNPDVETAMSFTQYLNVFCSHINEYFRRELFPVQIDHGFHLEGLNAEGVFNPVLPLFMEVPPEVAASFESSSLSSSSSPLSSAITVFNAEKCVRVVEMADLNLFLAEQRRTLLDKVGSAAQILSAPRFTYPKCRNNHTLALDADSNPWNCDARDEPGGCRCGDGTVRHTQGKPRWRCKPCDFDYCGPCYEVKSVQLPTDFSRSLISPDEGAIIVVLSHVQYLVSFYIDGVNFIEAMIRKQLVAAIGRELTPSDFCEYMRFHHTKVFKPQYHPIPFCYAVRRSSEHSPEGVVSIEERNTSSSGKSNVPTPIYSIADKRVLMDDRETNMEFSLNASTRISFGGERHLHAWLQHSFSGQSGATLELVSEARQFSSFIVLIGRISSVNTFDPKHAMIVKDKDCIRIPLNLEQIPSAKEFKDAIKSLSPEQQRFAQAFRSMQLESTLFGICIIQIKPQLEKVLKLTPDSLTKEIKLNQDLMELFIEYQIPSDLMSFGGDESADSIERLTQVKRHVTAMQHMVRESKDKEISDVQQVHHFRSLEDDSYLLDELSQQSESLKKSSLSFFGGVSSGGGGGARNSEMSRRREKGGGGAEGGVLGSASVNLESKSVAKKMSSSSSSLSKTSNVKSITANTTTTPANTTSTSNRGNESQLANSSNTNTNTNTNSDGDDNNNNALNVIDYTQIPSTLDSKFEELGKGNVVRPAIIHPASTFSKKSQKSLLAKPEETHLGDDEMVAEKKKAFDLLDALTKSGALTVEHASLHVVMCAVHCFDKSIIETIVQDNINPIEKVERSSLIMATTVHNKPVESLVKENQLERVLQFSPMLADVA